MRENKATGYVFARTNVDKCCRLGSGGGQMTLNVAGTRPRSTFTLYRPDAYIQISPQITTDRPDKRNRQGGITMVFFNSGF